MHYKKLKSVKNLKNKTVYVRVDWNVPIEKQKVLDDFRIKESLATIKFLLKKQAKVIVATHLGRPEGKKNKNLSVKPLVKAVKKYLPGQKIQFLESLIISDKEVEKLKNSNADLIILENVRFYPGNDETGCVLSKQINKVADIFVNEAFSVAHRKACSVNGISKKLPAYLGLTCERELAYLNKALKPKKPAVAIVGGAKIDSKFSVIENLLPKYSKILVVGGVGNLFLQAAGYQIGDSLTNEKYLVKAKKLLKSSRKIVLPADVVIADSKTKTKTRYEFIEQEKEICNKKEMILDIGAKSLEKYEQIIENAKTVVWAGPAGFTDLEKFSFGSQNLAQIITQSKATSIAGGGETIAVIKQSKKLNKFTFISTGGGAMLTFLAGGKMSGLN